ncbi:MAG: hypothetical protein ABR538_12190 [Candidatus Binatia bacterium]
MLLGLLDGFNPCALWVLLFILSLLVHLRSRNRMLLVAGTFVVVSGVVYFAFMAAWLNFFLLLGTARPVQVVLACVAMVAGAIHIKDYFAWGRGPSLSIPDSAKPWIARHTRRVLRAENLPATILVFTAVLTLHPQRLGETGGRRLKLVSGVMMVGLALLLLFRPEWLG